MPNRAEEVGRVGAEGDARGGARDEHDVGLREHLGGALPRRHAAEVVDAEDDAEPPPAAAASAAAASCGACAAKWRMSAALGTVRR